MYDCKECGGRGFIKQAPRRPLAVFEANTIPAAKTFEVVDAPCPNCGGLLQRTEYGHGTYRIRAYEAHEYAKSDKAQLERRALETAARGAFEALLRHGAFKLECPDIERALEGDPMAEVEYIAHMAVIMPAAHDFFADQIKAERLEAEDALLAKMEAHAALLAKGDMYGPQMAFGMRGFIRDVRDERRRAALEAERAERKDPIS